MIILHVLFASMQDCFTIISVPLKEKSFLGFLFCVLTFLVFYYCHHWLLVFTLKQNKTKKLLPLPTFASFKKDHSKLECDETPKTKKQAQSQKYFLFFLFFLNPVVYKWDFSNIFKYFNYAGISS